MPRARNIKPGFFRNEELVELPFSYRILFVGLWVIADRAGRLEDRPKRIKMEVFPADDVDINSGLDALQARGFLLRYSVDGARYIQVLNFEKHQNPHKNEAPSSIPAPGLHGASMVQAPESHGTTHADSLIPDSLIPEEDIPCAAAHPVPKPASRFEEFWAAYPKKAERKKAASAWKRRNLDRIADQIIADVQRRKRRDRFWLDGFIPNPTTYLNGDRWEDEIQEVGNANRTRSGSNGNGASRARRVADTLDGIIRDGLPEDRAERVGGSDIPAAAGDLREPLDGEYRRH